MIGNALRAQARGPRVYCSGTRFIKTLGRQVTVVELDEAGKPLEDLMASGTESIVSIVDSFIANFVAQRVLGLAPLQPEANAAIQAAAAIRVVS